MLSPCSTNIPIIVPDVNRISSKTQPDNTAQRLILASQSPQRRELLEQVGFAPDECCPVNADETVQADETPAQLVARLAALKAYAYLDSVSAKTAQRCVILGADTIIDLDGVVLGKPANRTDCVDTLLSLSDREHYVLSGVCLLAPASNASWSKIVSTKVRFAVISELQALAYWASGEPDGKAGSYAIQGLGAQFVAHLSGSYSNVVGLPLYETVQMLEQSGLSPNLSLKN